MVPTVKAALAPVVAGTCAIALFIAAEVAGLDPLSYGYPRNIAEAAGLGSAADVLHLAAGGNDPARIYPVRGEIISPAVRYVSGLEAAVWSRRVQLVQLLNDRFPIPAPERQRLVCLARELRTEDIESYLEEGLPSPADCQESVIDTVTARSTDAAP